MMGSAKLIEPAAQSSAAVCQLRDESQTRYVQAGRTDSGPTFTHDLVTCGHHRGSAGGLHVCRGWTGEMGQVSCPSCHPVWHMERGTEASANHVLAGKTETSIAKAWVTQQEGGSGLCYLFMSPLCIVITQ